MDFTYLELYFHIMKDRLTKEQIHQKMIQDIIDEFDFDTCHRVMKFLNWEWVSCGVPSVNELKKNANYLLQGAIEGCLSSKDFLQGQTYHSATGGLMAEAIKNKYNHLIHLKLSFVLSEWENDGD